MDLLTHLFLPITVAVAVRPDLFPAPHYLSVAVFAVLPDFDKLLGMPGLLHSLLGVGAVGVCAFVVEQHVRRSRTYATVATVLVASHLLLDFLDGGPVMLLYPLIDTGVGLSYPTQIIFGDAVHDVAVRDPLPTLRAGVAADASRETYPLINGYGVLSSVIFIVVYISLHNRRVNNNNDREKT